MTGASAPDRLLERLGYAFGDPELLARALTHRSAGSAHNERLEFLGDGLINFVVGQLLYERYPEATEGDLTYMRQSLVRAESLARIAERLALDDAVILGESVLKSGGGRRDSILGDALEAVFGAVFLDGGFAAARSVCERVFGESVAQMSVLARHKDPKTRLQEHLQQRSRPLPVYEASSAGPPHLQAFTVVCRLADSADRAEGHGSTRKSAEQQAAERMLALIAAESADA